MPTTNSRKQEQFVTKETLGELLTDQTSVILKAMEEGFESQDKRIEERFTAQNIALAAAMDKRLEPMEKRFNEKLDRLTTTLDRFLKRMTDVEEEFTFMKKRRKSNQSGPSGEARPHHRLNSFRHAGHQM